MARSQDYWPAELTLYKYDSIVVKDTWEINCNFDRINDQVYFNMRPNQNEEFTIVRKIYDVIGHYNRNDVWTSVDYILDDGAVLYIYPQYSDVEVSEDPNSFIFKLVERLPYYIFKPDIEKVEIVWGEY